MKNLAKFSIVTLLVIALTGCANMTTRDVGTIAGGVGGGILGSAVSGGNTAATIGGTLGGAYIGNQLTK